MKAGRTSSPVAMVIPSRLGIMLSLQPRPGGSGTAEVFVRAGRMPGSAVFEPASRSILTFAVAGRFCSAAAWFLARLPAG